MEDRPEHLAPPPLRHDVNFELTEHGYEIWFSDRIADDHPDLVDEFGDWLEATMGLVNLGQLDHRAVLADGVLTNEVRSSVLGWWAVRMDHLV